MFYSSEVNMRYVYNIVYNIVQCGYNNFSGLIQLHPTHKIFLLLFEN